jgi:hypothetical protein
MSEVVPTASNTGASMSVVVPTTSDVEDPLSRAVPTSSKNRPDHGERRGHRKPWYARFVPSGVDERRSQSVVTAILALGLLGCSDPLPEPYWHGEYISFAAEQPEQVCGGTLEYMDRRAGELFEKLGTEPVEVEYYLLDDLEGYCRDISIGCTSGQTIYTKWVPHLHEIVHARGAESLPLVLEEGLASYLGDHLPLHGLGARESLIELLTTDVDVQYLATGDDYGRAAHFIAFLDERFGWEAVRQLDGLLGRDSTSAQIDAAFVAAFELDVAGVLELYEDYPDCTGYADTSLLCAGPAEPPGFIESIWEYEVDCDSMDGIGPEKDRVFVERVIEMGPTLGNSRHISLTGDGADRGGFVLLRRCAPCSENGVAIISEPGLYFIPTTDLPEGRYLARFYLPREVAPATIGLRAGG